MRIHQSSLLYGTTEQWDCYVFICLVHSHMTQNTTVYVFNVYVSSLVYTVASHSYACHVMFMLFITPVVM